jgi:predicted RNase H-like nuclease (RuvC/YqgF family)
MWNNRVEHAKDVWALYPGQTAHLIVRCMNALYRLQAVRGEAMSQLMALVEATKITLDNREELVVDLSTEMVEKDLQVEQMANQIQELEELVGARENTIEVLEEWSRSLHPAWTLLAQGDHLHPSQALPRLLTRLQG